MLKVIKPGLWSSIQDKGRFGFKHFGVPSSGCMDEYSADLANRLLNNSCDDAVLEMTIIGPSLEFQLSSQICICGADMSPKINDVSILNNNLVNVKAGDVLRFGHLNYGARAYLAIRGGFLTEIEMDSRSYCENITVQNRVVKGDLLDYPEFIEKSTSERAHVKVDHKHFDSCVIECYSGPEYSALSDAQKTKLMQQGFTLSKDYSRMGFQLNENVENTLEPILSSAVIPGTVQLTPKGQLIVLMRDSQTTGGYPRVLQLSEQMINQLAQKKPGDMISFSVLDV